MLISFKTTIDRNRSGSVKSLAEVMTDFVGRLSICTKIGLVCDMETIQKSFQTPSATKILMGRSSHACKQTTCLNCHQNRCHKAPMNFGNCTIASSELT